MISYICAQNNKDGNRMKIIQGIMDALDPKIFEGEEL